MDARLSFAQIVLLIGYAAAMCGGQVLFKLAALRAPPGLGWVERILALAQNGFFVAAISLYAALAIVWVWILSFTPLSRAYVFVALAFAITPLAAGLIFGEPITGRLVIGIGFVVLGLVCVVG